MRKLKTRDQLVLASANPGKIAELGALLAPFSIPVVPITEYFDDELAEDGDTFEANALQKAQFAAELSGLPSLADDSGFCVAALNGDPGIYSARWAGSDKDFTMAMQKVHDRLAGSNDDAAHFVCVLALAFPDSEYALFRGEVHGKTVWPPRGDRGFGYDPIFVREGDKQTFAEIDPRIKEAISHRGAAFEKFRSVLPDLAAV